MKAMRIAIRALTAAGLFLTLSAGIPNTSKAEPGVVEATCVDLPDGAVSWWPGDENADDILNNNDGTLKNGATFAAGMVGPAFSFDGVDDFVEVANAPSVNIGTGDFSIDAWIQTTYQDLQAIMDKRVSTPGDVLGYHFSLWTSGLSFQMANGNSHTNYESGVFVNDGNFHHVAVTVHRSSPDGGRLYVDGAVVLTFDPTQYSGNLDNAADFRIGGHSINTAYNFRGLIDEMDFFNRALTEDEVRTIFSAGNAGKCKVFGGLITDFTASTKTARHGERVDFTLTLENPGTTDVAGVQVSDPLPNGFDFIEGSLTASSGTAGYHAGVISWNGDVTASSQVAIQFSISVNSSIPPGTYVTNTAEIISGGETFQSSVSILIDFYRNYLPCLNNACKPVYFDDFSNPASGWPIYEDQDYYANYENGEYRILLRDEYSWFASTPGVSFTQSDAYTISVDARSPSADQVYGTYGIIFGLSPGWERFYEFDIGPDGFYSIYLFDQGNWYEQTLGYSPAILTGTATNRLEIDYHDNLIDAFVNGQQISQVFASGLSGRVGLISFSAEGKGADTFFDSFSIFPYTCQPGSVRQTRIESGNPGTWQGEGPR